MMQVSERIAQGDEKARLVAEAMCYGISKQIGAMAAAMCGRVDAVILTGGIAHNEFVVRYIEQHCSSSPPFRSTPARTNSNRWSPTHWSSSAEPSSRRSTPDGQRSCARDGAAHAAATAKAATPGHRIRRAKRRTARQTETGLQNGTAPQQKRPPDQYPADVFSCVYPAVTASPGSRPICG